MDRKKLAEKTGDPMSMASRAGRGVSLDLGDATEAGDDLDKDFERY
jgi:hypothetical protein